MQHLDKQPLSAVFVAKLSEVGPSLCSPRLLFTVRLRVEWDDCEERFTPSERLCKDKQSCHSNQSHPCAECEKTLACKLGFASHKRKVHIVEYGLAPSKDISIHRLEVEGQVMDMS